MSSENLPKERRRRPNERQGGGGGTTHRGEESQSSAAVVVGALTACALGRLDQRLYPASTGVIQSPGIVNSCRASEATIRRRRARVTAT